MKKCFIVLAGVLVSFMMITGTMAADAGKMKLPADQSVKGSTTPDMKRGPAVIPGSITTFQGKVTDIKGNAITLKDGKGKERILEVDSASGLTIGADVWCEEDCRNQLRMADKAIKVRRVINVSVIPTQQPALNPKASGKPSGDPKADRGAKVKGKSRAEIAGSEEEDLEDLEVER